MTRAVAEPQAEAHDPAVDIDDYVRATVDAMPPLSETQVADLREIFSEADQDGARHA